MIKSFQEIENRCKKFADFLSAKKSVLESVLLEYEPYNVFEDEFLKAVETLVNISKESLSSPQGKKGITTNSNYVFVSKNQEMAQSFLSSSFYEMGNLSQKVQYLEMPMEVSYAILNKGKAHIKMNTGGFVGRVISNEVSLDNTSIGENSDVNEVIFGTILSSTLQYELFKKTKVFIEPGMNYYTQPVQNQNFNQFQLIFNFGLNLAF